MKKGGVLEFFAGIVVSDRYQGWSETWTAFAGHQACAAHLIRDFEDCAETYPGSGWPQQAQRALRGLIRACTPPANRGSPPSRQRSASPLSWSSAALSRSACPRCPASPARRPP
jgi:hypothetical protein